MRPKLTLKLVLSLFFAAILNKSVNAQITLLQDYKNNYSAPIGTFQGIKFKEGGFSGMYPIPNTNGKEFWVISDRGMNVDCINANPSTCKPTYDKMFGLPTYAPKIFRVKLNGDSVQILKTISIKRPGGTNATGIMNPTGFGSTAAEQASTDTVLNCSRFNLKIAAKDIWGIDAEGIVVDKDGNFWISEEGGPTIWKLDPNGVVISRFTPYANKVGAQAQDIYIDSCFAYRKNNRGFEGLSITPNGKIYAIIQSPILYPTTTIGEATRVHRIIEIDPVTNTSKMYVYLNDGPVGAGSNQIRFRDWKIGDMAAVNDSTFLLIDHAVRGTTDRKSIYLININGATAVNSGLYGGKTLEALVDSAGLAANGVKPVKKKLFLDLLANGWAAALDKPEGLAIINDSTIAVCNDNDFGQVCTAQDGIPVPTSTLCHIYTYGLKGSNKLSNFRNGPSTGAGPSSSATPYVEAASSGVKVNSLLTTGDAINGYRMCGTPDGVGAYDNGNGTFTVLINHEFGNTAGATRAHGSKGAFVSKWVINKSNLAVVSGSDLITKVKVWKSGAYKDTTTAFNRFCSADLPPASAFYNASTGLGTQERIFMNGEESGAEGRAFGHIVTGANAGTTYELPYLGKFSWENSIASPYASNKTVVAGTDDATPGQVYFYIGTKTNSGSEIDKAGLNGGKLFGVKVSGLTAESSSSIPSAGTAFTLYDLGQVQNTTGAALNSASDAAGVTTFLRPEDGAWDPSNPNDFYFVTTNSFTAPSRLWKLHFTDIANPENGGTITAVLDGTEGQKMLDNIGIDNYGHILMVEDVGGNAHLGKTWQYTIATDNLKLIATHDANRFVTGGSSYLTQDEEASGIIDVQNILGAGMFLTVDQAHYSQPGELVEGGQLLTLYNPDTYNASKGAGPSSSATPYLEPVASGVKTNALITAGDSVKGGYKFVGLPDGLGAYDNNDGTFSVLVNHEMGNTVGAVHAHGSKGAFVSKWVINKSNLAVVSGSDLITKVKVWKSGAYKDTTTAFNRFCSADLPPASAFYNAATGLGTQERIFMNGEEAGAEGRAFGHIVTGANAGTTYELPYLGKFSWENSIASPYASNKTVVAGTDDATPGQVYFYIGTKTNNGSEIDKAGLNGGKLFGVKVSGLTAESSSSIPSAGTAFTLYDLGQVQNTTGAALNSASDAAGVTTFLRPEDGAWDPSNPNDFYFATTNSFTAPSRLWKLHFTDIANPENGGTITAVLDGTEGPKMIDNIGFDKFGHIMLQEDVGNQVHNGKIWQYTIATDAVKLIAQHDPKRFILGGSSYLTQDEESSGIIDLQEILGAGYFLVADQAHYSIPGDLVEGGQLLTLYNPDTYNANPEVSVKGNKVDIAKGDITPSTTDNTDFGTLNTNTSVNKTFVVKNAGPGALIVNGISFSGTNASEFSVVGAPTYPASINANDSLIVTVKFAPLADGLRKATLAIANNDADENSYDFALQGTAVSPEINIQGNNVNIASGSTTPNVGNNTDFGTVNKGSNATKSFVIQNTGAGSLTITNFNFTGANASEFTLVGQPSLPLVIAANGSQNITVQFAPTAAGLRTATLNIASNDADEAAYTFALQGNGNTSSIKQVVYTNSYVIAPNPFDLNSSVKVDLVSAAKVSIEVFNLLGERVELVVNGVFTAGQYNFSFGNNQSNYPTGIYLVKVVIDGKVSTTKVIKNN